MCESVVLPIRFFFLLTRRPPRSTRTDTLFPYTTLFRSLAIIGVVHSHTHTDAYPSPTDVAQAPDPDWHYVIVSLRDEAPVLRSYRIVDGTIIEEPVAIDHRRSGQWAGGYILCPPGPLSTPAPPRAQYPMPVSTSGPNT